MVKRLSTMENNLCCVLNKSTECESCNAIYCQNCWLQSAHVDENKPGSWGICPGDGKTPGWAKFDDWNVPHILLATTDRDRMALPK